MMSFCWLICVCYYHCCFFATGVPSSVY